MWWVVYGLMSAIFAAIASIFDKTGVTGMDSNLATAVRTSTVVMMAWIIVFTNGTQHEVAKLNIRGWGVLLISGILTGLSWLSYFKAMSLADVSKVVPLNRISLILTIILASIFLNEAITLKTLIGGVLITIGTIVLVL